MTASAHATGDPARAVRPDADAIAEIKAQTTRAQALAADPVTSAWVSANAGTGKTHVLTRRVLRLLLAGAPPERILCLTYTKAAAAEMSTRVFRELGFWVTKSAADLDAALTKLLTRPPTTSETERARSLFARAIETPGGLKVQTIHAFAERLLQRFPLEAGVPPGFAILDDVMARQLLREAIDHALRAATDSPASPLGRALTTAVAYAADDIFDDVLRSALERKDWLEHVGRSHDVSESPAAGDPFEAVAPLYRRAFSIGPDETAQTLDARRAKVLSEAQMLHAAEVLVASDKTSDNRLGLALHKAAVSTTSTERLGHLAEAFLTKEGGARSDRQFVTSGIRQSEPALTDGLRGARDNFADLTDRRLALDVVEATLALMRLADAVLTLYARIKARRATLDFDDLIRHTASLLRTSEAAQWVLYKLDGGLDHILVDESQDTSPEQWRIVEALAAEFFSGAGARAEGSAATAPGSGPGTDNSIGIGIGIGIGSIGSSGTSNGAPIARSLFAVGDEKQSIYSFQGARPEEFARMGRTFRARARAAGVAWEDIPLTLSFRTVAPVLDAVDRVFADARRTPGLRAEAADTSGAQDVSPIVHAAYRIGHAGLVEIWDTEKATKTERLDAWAPETVSGDAPPAVRLAARMADRINEMIAGGERLLAEDRPITAGDIIILVRKRHPFARPMVAALKARGIPVAGADRLTLTEQIAVQDLVALGDFLTLPEDDLALANVLKSPLFGFDDEDLLAIAHGRKGTLWKALLDQRSSHPAYEEAAALLRDWRRRADFLPPYEFLAGVLDRDGMRQRLLSRLGAEAADSIDELINLAIAYDDDAPPSLTGFLTWLRESDREIKRDMEHGRDEVRIMTVHGAKGLEAPVVFLPDTCTAASTGRTSSLVPVDIAAGARPAGVSQSESAPSAFAWKVKGSRGLAPIAAGADSLKARERDELNRLLYVAMTRARDRLYVAGFEGKQARPSGCWYDLIRDGLDEHLIASEDASGQPVLRLESPQTADPVEQESRLTEAHAPLPLEPWGLTAAPREPQLTMPMAPSRLAPYDVDEAGEPITPAPSDRANADEPAAAPPRTLSSGNRFLRGTLTHALLEHLPEIPRQTWKKAAEAFIEQRGAELPPRVQRSIVTETLAVLGDSKIACLFGPQSRAEVAIAAEIPRPSGRGPALKLNGQIDRLAVDGQHVFIVDYKTNRPPPADVAKVADAYLFQLAAYRLALAQLFPDKALKAAILWTDGPRLMEISAARLEPYERRLWELDTSNLDAP